MDLQLFEKLRLIEIVAIADPQKVLKAHNKGRSTKLTKSDWPSAREENQYKYWLLQDGTVIPVEYAHNKTLHDASVEDEYGSRYDWYSFIKTGAVAGYFNLVEDEMGVSCGKKLTSKQIAKLKNLYLDYKVSTIFVEAGKMDFQSSIKSVSHLDYLLTYGKDVDESKTDEEEHIPAWTRSVGEKYLAEIESILQKAGYKGTIIGSVAIEGFSEHDLDIWLAPVSEEADFTVVEDEIPMEGMDYIGEDPPHYTILPDGKSVDFHLAEEEGELELQEKKCKCMINYLNS